MSGILNSDKVNFFTIFPPQTTTARIVLYHYIAGMGTFVKKTWHRQKDVELFLLNSALRILASYKAKIAKILVKRSAAVLPGAQDKAIAALSINPYIA